MLCGMPPSPPVRVWEEENGALLRLRLDRPPRNILDRALVAALHAALGDVAPRVRAVLLDAEGPTFSYGASIQEHLPAPAREALPEFHALVRRMLASPVPLAASVTGRVLGGGLELACACDVIFASHDATFATPEVRLGAFAPVASLLLPERVGAGSARDLLLSGRTVDAAWALRAGLAQDVSAEPSVAALSWLREGALSLSPASLRLATRAARLSSNARVLAGLDEVERLYLDELLPLPDAEEGVRAFLEKRPPRWSDPG